MKKIIILIILIVSPKFVLAQTDITLQDIANNIKKLEEKMDDRFDKIELTLARHDERFNTLNSKFTIFASIAGFVIMTAIAIFGFLFNKLYNLNRTLTSQIPLSSELFDKELKHLEQELEALKSKKITMDN